MSVLYVDATSDAHTVGCDACEVVLDPGERWAEPGPWTAAEALSAAERRGWVVTASYELCGGWHSPEALAALDAKVARRAAMA